MLTIKRDERGYLEVKEEIHGWFGTKTSYWYHDTDNWLVTSFGKEGDTPDRAMVQGEIDWVKTYYLPQLKETS